MLEVVLDPMKCLYCKKEFEAKRKTARYCSASCRKLAFQDKQEVSVPKDTKVSVPQTDKDRIGKAIKGYCHGCGQDIKKIKGLTTDDSIPTQEMADRICICLHCVSKGITHKSLGMDISKCQ